jgi:hypothetical protein
MEEGIFTWMGLLDCSLWSHPLRIGRTQSPTQQFLLLGFFITRRLTESELSTAPRNKKARTVRAGFVTPSGFKPETF